MKQEKWDYMFQVKFDEDEQEHESKREINANLSGKGIYHLIAILKEQIQELNDQLYNIPTFEEIIKQRNKQKG
jgi:hypothetical protein